MKRNTGPIEPNHFYHIYNCACGFDNLFQEKKNYWFFMELLDKKMHNYIDLLAFCLIPNHFHLLIKSKNLVSIKKKEIDFSKKFSNFFASYAQSYNHHFRRRGCLFNQNFRRRLITDTDAFRRVMVYIHKNPVKHNLVKSMGKWHYTSYHEYVSGVPRYCNCKTGMLKFGSMKNFNEYHLINPGIDVE